jgi:hypothetical protein
MLTIFGILPAAFLVGEVSLFAGKSQMQPIGALTMVICRFLFSAPKLHSVPRQTD